MLTIFWLVSTDIAFFLDNLLRSTETWDITEQLQGEWKIVIISSVDFSVGPGLALAFLLPRSDLSFDFTVKASGNFFLGKKKKCTMIAP